MITKIIRAIIPFLFLSQMYAQFPKDQFDMRLTIASPDTQITTLNSSFNKGEFIEGYYLNPRYDDNFTPIQRAELQPGGFNFLSPTIFGEITEFLGEKWIENDFPIRDLETMNNVNEPKRVLSFQIKPMLKNQTADTLSLFVKYSIYDFLEQKKYDLDFTYNIKLFYKLIRVPFDKKINLNFWESEFSGHSFELLFTRENQSRVSFSASLAEEILISAEESELGGADFSGFQIELLGKDPFAVDKFSSIAKYQTKNLHAYKEILNSDTNEKVKLPAKVYYGELNFPFILYNTGKAKQYQNYKTKGGIFQSDYKAVIVPISFENDSLTIDLILEYSKLNLNDGVPRWTPIRKRMTFPIRYGGASLQLPKENWSAVFTREGEEYEIYGYSDFEKYIDETLYIRLNNQWGIE